MIIGISGKLGSGKDYIGTNIVMPVLEKYKQKTLHLNFADQIKINIMSQSGIDYSDVYQKKTSTSRQLLQTEGTKVGRSIDPNFWINYLKNWIKVFNMRGIQSFVVTDVRYKNEFEYIKNSGGIVIKVIAPERNKLRLIEEGNDGKISQHCSECDLDLLGNDMFDLVIFNDPNDTQPEQKQFEEIFIQKMNF